MRDLGQQASIQPGLAAVGFKPIGPSLRERFVEQLLFYYLHLDAVARAHPDRIAVIDNAELRDNLEHVVRASLAALNIDVSAQFADALVDAGRRSLGFSSKHAYTLEEYGLSESMIETRFAAVYRNRAFGQNGIPAADV